MEFKLVGPSVGAVVLALCAPVASASAIGYFDTTSFDAAVVGSTSYNFEGIAPVGGAVLGPATVGGVLFSGGGGNDQAGVWDSNNGFVPYGTSIFNDHLTDAATPGSDPAVVDATLSGATAIGFTYGDYVLNDAGIAFTVTLSTGDSFDLTMPSNAGTTGFVGFTSDTPITDVTFADFGLNFDLTQFVVASVPEPATLSLFGLGLAGVAFMRRRRKAESA